MVKIKPKPKVSKKPKRYFFQYDENSLRLALIDIRENGMNARAACRKYGVPRTTVQDRLSGRIPEGPRRMGKNTVLNANEEAMVD